MTTENTTGTQPVNFELITGLVPRVPDDPPEMTFDVWEIGAYGLISYATDLALETAIKLQLSMYRGQKLLEVFSGHDSYFRREKFESITAIDGCKQSLLRYPHTDAVRYACNLDQLNGWTSLQFLESESFDLASICFGYIYPCNIDAVLLELKRVLKPGGMISFVESPMHGYGGLAKREFSLESFLDLIIRAGLKFRRCVELFAPAVVGNEDRRLTLVSTDIYHIEVAV